MGDILCAKCGEPWDAYGVKHGDMESWEARRFLAGYGCPCCVWGEQCPTCSGTGKDTVQHYPVPCCENGRRHAWKSPVDAPDLEAGAWYVGHRTPGGAGPIRVPSPVHLVRRTEGYTCRDGFVETGIVACPTCSGNGAHLEPCV